MIEILRKQLINKCLLIAFITICLTGCSITGEVNSYKFKNFEISNVSDTISDQEFMRILEPYSKQLDSSMSQVISISKVAMLCYRPESPRSNFVSDLVLDYARNLSNDSNFGFIPQISIINHGSIRASLPEGEISIRNAYELMPFENELILLELTGQQIIELANYICTREGEGVSGISFGMKGSEAVNIKVQGVRVDDNKRYWVATSDYVANGGDGMKVFKWALNRVATGYKLREIIIEHMQTMHTNGKKLFANEDGRIYYVQ